jgi:deoxyribonuclease-4
MAEGERRAAAGSPAGAERERAAERAASARQRAAVGRERAPLGAHVSVAGGVAKAIARGEALGCEAIQIFAKNANQWRARPLDPAEAAAFRAARETSPTIGPALSHASYLINLAATDAAILERSRAALADELTRAHQLGLDGVVVHPGAHLGAGEEAGIERVAAAIDRVLTALPDLSPRLLLENTAGQGTVLGHRLQHLAAIRDRLAAPSRVGFTLDTCHAFAAGYPIHQRPGYEDFAAEAAEVLGLAAIRCWHLNDSLRPFASRRDRHAHIGEGEIGTEPFGWLIWDERFRRVPMVSESEPGAEGAEHRRDLDLLRSLGKS